MNLTAGGGSIQFVKEKGSPSAVSNFIVDGEITGTNLLTSLPFNYLFQTTQRSSQFLYSVISGNQFFVKIAGNWKMATAFVKISGVWKQATPYIKINGIWK